MGEELPEVRPARIVVDRVTPVVDGGRYPVKRVVGEPVVVGATVYADGHDRLWCAVAHQPPGAEGWALEPMVAVNPGLDRWEAAFVPRAEGVHRYRVVAWVDEVGTWAAGLARKVEAGVDVAPDLLVGGALLGEALDAVPGADELAHLVEAAHAALRLGDATASDPVLEAVVEPESAMFNSWYELFPRSWGPPGAHGTLADVEAHLPYVADMGFDVLYLPPVHPIGRSHRKGPDNAEVAGPDDPGSPWAIGSVEGGHTAVHPQLGTVQDVGRLAAAARAEGIELAMDVAFQCSPDHPWVTEHPTWFRHRPDGSVQYAENPPKAYQDIYPLDFDSADWRGLWDALLDVFLFWADQGVTTFRVDNPHTKPFAFWEWAIGRVRTAHPRARFLSEAFTRPEVVHRLAKVGFTLSYSYFPWRRSKAELVAYFTELASVPSVDQLRPSCWPTTPDILPRDLWGAPPAHFAVRAFLAATLSPSWGVYGPAFELAENGDAGNGKEEYARSEKYEIRSWDRDDPATLRPLLADLNRIRRDQLALRTLRTLRFHTSDNDQLLAWSKTPHAGPSVDPETPHAATVLVVANLDGTWRQGGTVGLDLAALGVDGDRPFEVHDLVADRRFTWDGDRAYVELDPAAQPGHVFRVAQPPP